MKSTFITLAFFTGLIVSFSGYSQESKPQNFCWYEGKKHSEGSRVVFHRTPKKLAIYHCKDLEKTGKYMWNFEADCGDRDCKKLDVYRDENRND